MELYASTSTGRVPFANVLVDSFHKAGGGDLEPELAQEVAAAYQQRRLRFL